MLDERPEPGRQEQPTKIAAVHPGGMRLVVQPGPADVYGRRVAEELSSTTWR